MAKRKHVENAGAESSVPAGAVTGNHDAVNHTSRQDHAVEDLGGLAEEVQSFLSRRSELARKLTQEIEATEKKLAELKRTAALLFPAESQVEVEKERPERKPKKVSVGRPVKTEREAVVEEKQLREDKQLHEDRQLRIETMDAEPAEIPAAASVAPETPQVAAAESDVSPISSPA